MPKIVTTEQMRAIEQAADAKSHTYADMMALAGRAVAVRAMTRLAGLEEPRVVVLVGPRNNGGDGLVAARILVEELEGASVAAYLLKPRAAEDAVFAAARDAGVFIAEFGEDKAQGFRVLQTLVENADLIIDAIFGTSVRLPIRGNAAKLLQLAGAAIERRRREAPMSATTTPVQPETARTGDTPYIIAVDCPSGLDCDTGELDKLALHAHETVTFAAAKPGLLTFPGAEAVGTLHVGDIGLPDRLPELEDVTLTLVDASEAGRRLPPRPLDGHKGTFGRAMVVAGSLNYTGAAYLAGAAAYRVGAGLVTIGAPQIIVPTLAGMLPEATWLLLPHDLGVINAAAVKVLRQELEGYSALLLGPGFGREEVTGEFMRELLQPEEEIRHSRAIGFVPTEPAVENSELQPNLPPLVIDADGLNLLAAMADWPSLVPSGSILTPHPGEFARLAGLERAAVQGDRLALARAKAAEWGCVVVLKGAFTVVAAPDGRAAVQPFATSALASAGTGDVLAGAITGLLAQGLEPYDAAVTGAWLHGWAGLRAAELLESVASVMAGDVLEMLPDALATLEPFRRQSRTE